MLQETPRDIKSLICLSLEANRAVLKDTLMPPLANLLKPGEALTMDHLFNWVPMWFEKGEITARMYRTPAAKKVIFAHGKTYMNLGAGTVNVNWIAVADIANRWYIIAGPAAYGYDYIYNHGQRIISPTTINRMVQCDWEALQMYFV